MERPGITGQSFKLKFEEAWYKKPYLQFPGVRFTGVSSDIDTREPVLHGRAGSLLIKIPIDKQLLDEIFEKFLEFPKKSENHRE